MTLTKIAKWSPQLKTLAGSCSLSIYKRTPFIIDITNTGDEDTGKVIVTFTPPLPSTDNLSVINENCNSTYSIAHKTNPDGYTWTYASITINNILPGCIVTITSDIEFHGTITTSNHCTGDTNF